MQAQLNHSAAIALDTTSGSGNSSPSSGSNTNITANDFLTLLVAEMKNQDPTATTDPNAYIDQLVQVNSLEQLIQINQGIGNLDSGSTAGTNSHATSAAHAVATALSSKSENRSAQNVQTVLTQQQVHPS
jgi:flagellar basal-body rod modification protein FlgD